MDYKERYNVLLEQARKELATCRSLHCCAARLIFRFFPELKESEDERIRKWLIEIVEELRKANPTNVEHNGNCSDAIAYLEKQKGFQFGYPGLYFYDGEKLHFQGNPAMEENPYDFAMSKQDEQQPAEWSEEDEEMLDAMVDIVANSLYEPLCPRDKMLCWLKSLRHRPHWKPSEIQMESLMRTITWLVEKGNHTDSSTLADLRRELQKLM